MADLGARGRILSVAHVDVTAAFPLGFHLAGMQALLCAESIRRSTVTTALRRACERAVNHPLTVLDPDVILRFGRTLAHLVPMGEPFPTDLEDAQRPDGRLEVVPLYSPDRPFQMHAFDVLRAAVMARRAPTVLEAVSHDPVGEQGCASSLPVYPGFVLDLRVPMPGFVIQRSRAKDVGDTVFAAELHAIVNSLVSGNPSRMDEVLARKGSHTVRSEIPGPRTFMPVAVGVQAFARLLLGVLDRLVADRGGIVVYRDTDSSLIPASQHGGIVVLNDDRTARELSFEDVEEILAAFENLSPGSLWPVWKVECTKAVVFGPKRHAEFEVCSDGLVKITNRTESNLGGTFVDPPTMRGRAPDGGRLWTLAAVEREIKVLLTRCDDTEALRPPAVWDMGEPLPFPALQRFIVKTPEMARTLPTALCAKPGTRYVVGVMDEIRRGPQPTPIALDPGGDLRAWRRMAWIRRSTGAPLRVTTDPRDLDAVLLETLGSRAARWSSPPSSIPITEIVVDPLLVTRVGRVSGVIDADLDGIHHHLAARRPLYVDAQRAEVVSTLAREMGPRDFALATGIPVKAAERVAGGGRLSPKYLDEALRALRLTRCVRRRCPVDGRPVLGRVDAVFCSSACKNRAYRRRRKATRSPKEPGAPSGRREVAT